MSTILLSGASGFIGSHLTKALARDGHRVVRLSRKGPTSDAVAWVPESGKIDREALARARPDAVVNLAGEPIDQRWTEERKRQIRDSRVKGTALLAEALASLADKPKTFVSGSAMGYYGAHRGDEVLEETSAPGTDFLAQTAQAWERATDSAAAAGIRVVLSRTSLVLGRDGGALKRLLVPFRLGMGGRVGDGRQWMSWIALDDAVRAMRFFIDTPALEGPVNLAAPEPVRNEEFTRVLAKVLHRPAAISVPASALELVLGQMANDTIMASQRLSSRRLAGAGFEFQHPRLDDALRSELTR
ncbi:MAG TPA: TIGR01777 family oxidoreductase [Gemmatimonadaceae bacterium]|nr:TIGR01777 family oxidoreductase [Gemmatimonadaceae bacterium]